ncbi:MAG TPA: 4-carboxymuconolactone decarboxylase [Vicinamibacteria bacterium]
MDERRRYARGLRTRRRVLGDEHVEEALRRRTALTADFQDLITRYAWGEIWTRRGLPRTTRSLVTLAALVALGRSEELRMHLRAALRNGVGRDQVKEVLLQMAVYCGVPAANSAFQRAAEVFAEVDAGGRARPRPRTARRRRRKRPSKRAR